MPQLPRINPSALQSHLNSHFHLPQLHLPLNRLFPACSFSSTAAMDKNPAFEQARQKMEETQDEREQRQKSGFKLVEAALPKIASRFEAPIIDTVSSYFGRKNPMASAAKPETESVWLLDNTAYRPVHPYPHQEQPWQAEFVAAYFQRGSGKDVSKVCTACGALEVSHAVPSQANGSSS